MHTGFHTKKELGAASSLGSALKMLLNEEIVIRENEEYMIHDAIMTRWLQSI